VTLVPSHKDQDFLEFVLDQLARVKPITSRRMFGGIGLYQETTFFAIIDDGRLYFVTDEMTRPAYVDRGMRPFQYAPGKFIHTYYEVPVDVLEDDRELGDWAQAAVAAQARRGKKKPARPSKSKTAARESTKKRPRKKSR
jgi:DNA transformation protein